MVAAEVVIKAGAAAAITEATLAVAAAAAIKTKTMVATRMVAGIHTAAASITEELTVEEPEDMEDMVVTLEVMLAEEAMEAAEEATAAIAGTMDNTEPIIMEATVAVAITTTKAVLRKARMMVAVRRMDMAEEEDTGVMEAALVEGMVHHQLLVRHQVDMEHLRRMSTSLMLTAAMDKIEVLDNRAAVVTMLEAMVMEDMVVEATIRLYNIKC